MEGISDLRIIGIDELRPPRILKEPYINLYFKLTHEAPEDWCKSFNELAKKSKNPATIDPAKGLFVDTWVRKPEEIEKALDFLKLTISDCTEAYIARIAAEAATASDGDKLEDTGEQGRLNKIVAALDFDA